MTVLTPLGFMRMLAEGIGWLSIAVMVAAIVIVALMPEKEDGIMGAFYDDEN